MFKSPTQHISSNYDSESGRLLICHKLRNSTKGFETQTIPDENETIILCTRPRSETRDLKFWSRDWCHVSKPEIADIYSYMHIFIYSYGRRSRARRQRKATSGYISGDAYHTLSLTLRKHHGDVWIARIDWTHQSDTVLTTVLPHLLLMPIFCSLRSTSLCNV